MDFLTMASLLRAEVCCVLEQVMKNIDNLLWHFLFTMLLFHERFGTVL